jgi:hypothetical protein
LKPLLSSGYPCELFSDSSLHLGNARLLSSLSVEMGYLFCKGLIPVKLLEPIRNFVRIFVVAKGGFCQTKGKLR